MLISPFCHLLEKGFAMILKRRLPSLLSCFEDPEIVVSNLHMEAYFVNPMLGSLNGLTQRMKYRLIKIMKFRLHLAPCDLGVEIIFYLVIRVL